MLEFYEAYADYRDLMDLTEDMLRRLTIETLGTTTVSYQGETYDFGKPFARMTVKESIPALQPSLDPAALDDPRWRAPWPRASTSRSRIAGARQGADRAVREDRRRAAE